MKTEPSENAPSPYTNVPYMDDEERVSKTSSIQVDPPKSDHFTIIKNCK